MRKIHFIQLGVLVILVFFFYPIKRLLSPDWVVRVIDENHHPVAGAQVTEDWFEAPGTSYVMHTGKQLSGPDGLVHFKPQSQGIAVGLGALGCFTNILTFLYHGSCGAHASVSVFKCNYGYMPTDPPEARGHDWNGSPEHVDSDLFLRFCSNGGTGFECDTLPLLGCMNNLANK
jgi:hypothetical protein